MHEISLMDAFASYKAKSARRARSAMTPDGDLVISCWYGGFKKTQAEVLRYEEDLAGQSGEIAKALRAHLATALSQECDVRVIVASGTPEPKEDAVVSSICRSYYARKDLVGLVSSFDGERFVIDFRQRRTAGHGKIAKGASLNRQFGAAGR
jgi:hypothetical protein